jgi:hypothetical protein
VEHGFFPSLAFGVCQLVDSAKDGGASSKSGAIEHAIGADDEPSVRLGTIGAAFETVDRLIGLRSADGCHKNSQRWDKNQA